MSNYINRADLRRRKQKEYKFSKKIVVWSITLIIIFTIGIFFMYWHSRFIPDSLIYSFYAFFGTEMLALAGIRKKQVEHYNDVPPGMLFPPSQDAQNIPHYGEEEKTQ
jgi:hypothetical protein